jgi:hypothetical protein
MSENEKSKVIFFDTEQKYRIGNTSYVVESHYDDKKEDLITKIKRLLKHEVQKMA